MSLNNLLPDYDDNYYDSTLWIYNTELGNFDLGFKQIYNKNDKKYHIILCNFLWSESLDKKNERVLYHQNEKELEIETDFEQNKYFSNKNFCIQDNHIISNIDKIEKIIDVDNKTNEISCYYALESLNDKLEFNEVETFNEFEKITNFENIIKYYSRINPQIGENIKIVKECLQNKAHVYKPVKKN